MKLSLSEKSLQLEQAFRKLQDISASFQSVSVEISRGEHENSILHKRLGDSEQNESDLSKRLFDAETQVETLQADLLLARQDLAFRDTELYNLRNAIEGLSRDADHRVEVMKKDGDRILNQELEKRDKECSVLKENYEQKISILLDNVKEAQQRETDESLLRRKSELEYVSERKRLQTAVEQAMLRLQNSNEDLVDRAVIANLIVTYFKRNRY